MLHLLFALAAATPIEAPITAVTVFSDRARVTRTAPFHLSDETVLALPLLPDRVDASSIRVQSTGAALRRIEIHHLDSGEFPRDRALVLLRELERVDDQIARANAEHQTTETLLENLIRLAPVVPEDEALKPRTRLTASGWPLAIAFVERWVQRLQQQQLRLDQRLRPLREERQRLADEASLVGGAQHHTGYRVLATVATGSGKLTVTYLVANARWRPSYDLQLDLATSRVAVSFAGMVSQESGEDWTDAVLQLSTAVPATAVAFTPLSTWKIGERERFIPTPRPLEEQYVPPPPAPPPLPASDDESLRQQLLERTATPAPAAPSGSLHKMKRAAAALDAEGGTGERAEAEELPAAPALELSSPTSPSVSKSEGYWRHRSNSAVPPPSEGVGGLLPPAAYQPPRYAADLPASLAGGYDLAFPSLRSETIPSGKGARRIALLAEEWPVTVERKLYPALAPEAFLVAEIRNPSSHVLPGGPASLWVGADPAGSARLGLMARGEHFALPLGLDRAIKPLRRVKLVSSQQGIFSKDDVGDYTVTTEVANPYRTPLSLRIVDQVPVTSDPHVEIKLLSSVPAAVVETVSGKLEWQLVIPPSSTTAVHFTYQLRRPKGWRMHQN